MKVVIHSTPQSRPNPFQKMWDELRPSCGDCALGKTDCQAINPLAKEMSFKCWVPMGTIFVFDEKPI